MRLYEPSIDYKIALSYPPHLTAVPNRERTGGSRFIG